MSKKAAKQKTKNRRGEALGTERAHKLQREGAERRERQRLELSLKRCAKAVERLETELRAHCEPKPNAEELAEAFKIKKKERLYGGARPWDSREKSPHGCGYDMYECMGTTPPLPSPSRPAHSAAFRPADMCGDWENEPEAVDLLKIHAGRLMDNEATRPYCRALLDLGRAQQQSDQLEAAIKTFR